MLSFVQSLLGSSSLAEQAIAEGGLRDVWTPCAPQVCAQHRASSVLSRGSVPRTHFPRLLFLIRKTFQILELTFKTE